MRVSVKEAIEKGWITKDEGKKITKPKRKTGLRSGVTRQKTSPCQDRLCTHIHQRWPGRFTEEFEDAVPGRKFRIDIAAPLERIAIEVDGWQYHGKYLSGFKKDREKQNLLSMNGWKILRYTYSDIMYEIDRVMGEIQLALELAAAGQS